MNIRIVTAACAIAGLASLSACDAPPDDPAQEPDALIETIEAPPDPAATQEMTDGNMDEPLRPIDPATTVPEESAAPPAEAQEPLGSDVEPTTDPDADTAIEDHDGG